MSSPEAAASSKRIPGAGLVVIPAAVDIPVKGPARQWMPGGLFRILYLGRLDPIKGIENLIEALGRLDDINFELAVYGTGDAAYLNTLRTLSAARGITDRVRWMGHVDGDAKERAFEEADVCVLPSFSENFGMIVAEALAHGVPVIAGKGTAWKSVQDHSCGLWIDNSPASLENGLRRLSRMDLAAMGARGRAWMASEFTWQRVAQQMHALYSEMANTSNA